MAHAVHRRLLSENARLTHAIKDALGTFAGGYHLPGGIAENDERSSAVLFVVGDCPSRKAQRPEPCLILNKRSNKVRQPGDLCFPGGGVMPFTDRLIAAGLGVWPRFCKMHINPADPGQAKFFRIYLAAALREAWEEIRLNPLKVNCLGYLPLQELHFVNKMIWPMVIKFSGRLYFKPNWEVARLVSITLQDLLDARHYARFRPMIKNRPETPPPGYPCFVHQDDVGRELLWGATFRMVTDFLRIVFGFKVPEIEGLPEVEGHLAPDYPIPSP